MALIRRGVFASLCVGSLLVSTGVLAGGKDAKVESPPPAPVAPKVVFGAPPSSRDIACNLRRGQLASLEQKALVAADYVAWVARYRAPKAELDRAVEACFQGVRTFSYGPIRSPGAACYGKYTNPCAPRCYDGGKAPPVIPGECRESFCKRARRLIANIATESPGTEALMLTSSEKFGVIVSLNADRDRYRRELGLTGFVVDDPDPAIVESEAINARTDFERRLPAARDAVARACGG
jgi:hypothetical protein